jgi:hypothetical protein
VLVENAVNGGADAAPDIIGGLFLRPSSASTPFVECPETHVVTLLGLPQTNVLRG